MSQSPDRAVADHPFAVHVRAVARGQSLSKPLSEAAAETAMAQVLEGAVEPVQLGAFLAVLRYRKETAAELAGFVRAARRHLAFGDGLGGDLDWPSYADRHKQLPYFILAALLVGRAGVRVVMHGLAGQGGATTPAALAALGIAPATTAQAATDSLARHGLAYLPIATLCPPLAALFALRPILGVRTAANSFARALNPAAAPAQIVGVFHPSYLATHRELAQRLGQARTLLFKGGGGESQRNPEKPCRMIVIEDGGACEETWPALCAGTRHGWRDEALEAGAVADHVVEGQAAPDKIVGEHTTLEGQQVTVTGSGDNLKVNESGSV